ncbi:isocitrate dehydrogenase (NADP(+)) [Vibrio owensii]|uniref:6-carboxytetrahydropterin synthase n=1 Tax=Vibrio owensii TaxID=696485 RepID=UPI00039A5689|nr:6-carboxytetrahydropterin synthase [Vibrio owensii]SUP41017.1 isocitrate dehydrogenase (NADP(+)) [Vibrio owensii]
MNLFVNDLTVIDASYLCETRGMVGESWILDVVMHGDLNEMSMVLDFSKVKKQIKQLVDQYVDHRLLVPVKNSAVERANTKEGYTQVDLMRGEKSIHLHCPDEAFCFVDAQEISIESITQHIHQVLQGHLPTNVASIDVTLRHEKLDGAYYHYTHGLKKHDGNCQRIAHGHRSPIQILVDGQRDTAREDAFAQRWQDIYLASIEDLVEISHLELSEHASLINCDTHFGFRYTTSQGDFQLAIAHCETEVLNTDTTVELLAVFIANEIAPSLDEGQSLQIIAYEGVGKGAMAFR